MAGPGDSLLQDAERGASQTPSASDKVRGSTDVRAYSAQPSSDGEQTVRSDANSSNRPNNRHPLVEKLAARVPSPVRKRSSTVWTYLKGPEPPRIWKIRPFLPKVQHLPLTLVNKACRRQWQRILALLLFYICWIATFAAVLHKSSVAGSVPGYGQPLLLQCGSTFWSSNNGCGLNGTLCIPFSNSSFAFRCPSSCLSEEVLNVRAVGDQEVIYEPLVVGGPTPSGSSEFTYRGDSFICSAAIHAGIIDNINGGCGVVSLIGEQTNYPAVSQNGISSIGFDSSFPSSFTFQATDDSCKDLSFQLLAVSVAYTAVLSVFTQSASVFFYSTLVGSYLQAALATAKPSFTSLPTLVSTAMGKLLPALFIAMVVYRLYIRRTLHGLTAQFEKTILWLGPFWVAVLADYTFELIPLERLTAHDIRQQPGGLAALIIIILVLLVAFVGQAWAFRVEGRLLRYLGLYIGLGLCIGLLAAVPNEEIRIHHYILGLLLLPGTSLQTRPSLVYQGILVGLFVNGVARWGFDAILETAAALQGDALVQSALPAITVAAANASASNITFSWPGVAAGYAGTSVLINDVERYRDYSADQTERSFTWQRVVEGEPAYFRFGFFTLSAAFGLETGDYTRAGTWLANGTWIQMGDGAT